MRLCSYCLNPSTDLHRDHIVPVHPKKGRMGGTDDPENLVPACQACNSLKSNKSLLEFVHVVEFRKAKAAARLVSA